MATALGNRLNGKGAETDEQALASLLKSLGYALGKEERRRQLPGRCFQDFLGCVAKGSSSGWAGFGRDATEQAAANERLEKVYDSAWGSSLRPQVSKATMGEESGVVGGYLVPQDYSLALMDSIAEHSIVYPRARIVPMLAAETLCPRIDVETVTTAAGITPFFGGVQFKWGSSQAPAETEPTFRQMSLKAWDLLGYAIVSNQWLADTGPQGEESLVKLFGEAAAWYADYAFFQGTGSAQQMPLGIINAVGRNNLGVANNTGPAKPITRQTGSTVTAQDLATMAGSLLPFSWRKAIWAVSPDVLTKIAQLSQVILNQFDAGDGSVGAILTRPLFVSEKLPTVGTPGDVILMDPSLYVVGVRQEVLIDVSPHALFQNNQTVFRIWLRLDGKPQTSKVITDQTTTRTLAPFVVLQ